MLEARLTESDTMDGDGFEKHAQLMEEIRSATLDVQRHFQRWNMVDPAYEPAAWLAYRAACERLNALLREAKEDRIAVAGW
ncbi:MAG: hypothetical protein K6T78_12305 [Alicyclobacillus sp.]|nr:hypothetical protein [Alicyclobacillus sp.]